MTLIDFIDLSDDEEIIKEDQNVRAQWHAAQWPTILNCQTVIVAASVPLPLPRQFWKAGEYKVATQAVMHNGPNKLRVHPKFLHSNATSHKWAFGAIAELLDNAVDEVHNGASFVRIDKMKYSPNGDYSLVIQDNGGGMSPESLRRCMSFGFSDKYSDSSIGQYGNGFKTSTMRLGADVIVFSCRPDNRRLTLSVGLLSYSFLMRTGCNDVIVPIVDYEFNLSSRIFKRIMDRGKMHFSSNLSTLLRWSPFHSENELLKEFGDIECHGTKIIIFNLWFNDAGEMELDFTSDEEDIMINGAPRIPVGCKGAELLNQMHIANRFRYSLRVYASILYLHLPENFEIILCGQVVEPHHIVSDLKYCECIKYQPQTGLSTEADVITTIGFLDGVPRLKIYGFNVYHKNRLILPFWPSGSSKTRIGNGIAGVLEANFIRPTHDKQDFEKSPLFQRLETRLKDMMLEYWKYHCHLVGYTPPIKSGPSAQYTSASAAAAAVDNEDDFSLAAPSTTLARHYSYNSRAKSSELLNSLSNDDSTQNCLHDGVLTNEMDGVPYPLTHRNSGELRKRGNSCSVTALRGLKKQNSNGCGASRPGSKHVIERGVEEIRMIVSCNNMLKAQCLELETAEQQLLRKVDNLRTELKVAHRAYEVLMHELKHTTGIAV